MTGVINTLTGKALEDYNLFQNFYLKKGRFVAAQDYRPDAKWFTGKDYSEYVTAVKLGGVDRAVSPPVFLQEAAQQPRNVKYVELHDFGENRGGWGLRAKETIPEGTLAALYISRNSAVYDLQNWRDVMYKKGMYAVENSACDRGEAEACITDVCEQSVPPPTASGLAFWAHFVNEPGPDEKFNMRIVSIYADPSLGGLCLFGLVAEREISEGQTCSWCYGPGYDAGHARGYKTSCTTLRKQDRAALRNEVTQKRMAKGPVDGDSVVKFDGSYSITIAVYVDDRHEDAFTFTVNNNMRVFDVLKELYMVYKRGFRLQVANTPMDPDRTLAFYAKKLSRHPKEIYAYLEDDDDDEDDEDDDDDSATIDEGGNSLVKFDGSYSITIAVYVDDRHEDAFTFTVNNNMRVFDVLKELYMVYKRGFRLQVANTPMDPDRTLAFYAKKLSRHPKEIYAYLEDNEDDDNSATIDKDDYEWNEAAADK